MTFDISEYRRIFFEIPLVFVVVITCGMLITIGKIVRTIRPGNPQHISRYLIHILLLILLANQICAPLLRGGMWLYSEDVYSCKEVTGTITQIEKIGKYEVLIWIDDVQYTIIDEGTLSQGDRVALMYLPKSKYILEINQLENVS